MLINVDFSFLKTNVHAADGPAIVLHVNLRYDDTNSCPFTQGCNLYAVWFPSSLRITYILACRSFYTASISVRESSKPSSNTLCQCTRGVGPCKRGTSRPTLTGPLAAVRDTSSGPEARGCWVAVRFRSAVGPYVGGIQAPPNAGDLRRTRTGKRGRGSVPKPQGSQDARSPRARGTNLWSTIP